MVATEACYTVYMKLKVVSKTLAAAVRHLFKRFVHSPLLVGWVIVGTIIETILHGYLGLINTCLNLVLLAFFAVVVKVFAEHLSPKSVPVIRRPMPELITGLLLYVFVFIVILVFWGQIDIPYFSASITNLITFFDELAVSIGRSEWISGMLGSAVFSTMFMTIPVIVLFLCWGYGPKKMGFVFGNVRLIAILVGASILLGLGFGVLFQQPLSSLVVAFLFAFLINALPEELFFRGYLLPRFETVLKNPMSALGVVALLFNMFHIPSYLAQGMDMHTAVLTSIGIGYPTGLIWGYLYLKTRSIVPGVIWHASNVTLGMIFIGM